MKSRPSKMRRREAGAAYVFMVPAIIGVLVFALGPMVASLFLSFTEYDMLSDPSWVGLDNYAALIEDPLFRNSLKVSLIYSAVSVPLTMVLAFLLAMLLNSQLPVMTFFRSAYYLPSVISGVAVAMVWRWLYNGEHGLINQALGAIGIDGPAWLTDERWALRSLIVMSVWSFGGTMLIYLAGLQSMPKDLYEAAEVDGANKLRQHWHITVPMLSNVTFFNLVMGLIGSLQVFAEPFVLTGGGPNNSTMLLPLYLYQNAFTYLKMGYASAIAWVAFGIVMLLTLLVFKSSPMWVHTEASDER